MLAGIEWADRDATARALQAAEEIRATGYSSHKGSVINMSLGAGLSRSLSDGAKKAYDHGHHVVVAAGNENVDACQSSPGDVPEIFTVAASTVSDRRWDDSNWGDCVDIFAPGHRVTSCGTRSDSSAVTADGTSMATPHVSGVLAARISNLHLSARNLRPKAYVPECSLGGLLSRIQRSTSHCFLLSPQARVISAD